MTRRRALPEPPAEPDFEVDPDALRGPFVLLDPPLDGEPITVPPRDPRFEPQAIAADRFVIEEVVATGESGAVYKALDRQTRDPVALRVIHGAASRREIRRFLGACARHAQRYHPRVVRVLQRGTIAGRMFLAMDWISGETLAARLARQPLTMRQAATVIGGVLQALQLVHTMGLAQGNLRPGRVFLRNRQVEWGKLLDIDVWRETPLLSDLPLDDLVYVAPEVVRTGVPSPRGDLYSLGVLAFRLLAGVPPFEAEDEEDLATRRWAPAEPLAELRPDAPPSLCRLVDELLQRDPSRRPRDASAVTGWPGEKEDLGWGADRPPLPIDAADKGRRRAILPARVPVDPLADGPIQEHVAAELAQNAQGSEAIARLGDIARAQAGASGDRPGCALCGRGPRAAGTLIEVRDRTYSPLEGRDAERARPPSVCARCADGPFEEVDRAIRRTLESHAGDDATSAAPLGPTRGEVRAAILRLYERALPRMGEGACLSCGARGQAVIGRDGALCGACRSDLRRALATWLGDAPERKRAWARAETLDAWRRAAEKVRGGPSRGPWESEAQAARVGSGPRTSARRRVLSGALCRETLDHLRGTSHPPSKLLDEIAIDFADILFEDIEMAFRQIAPPDGVRATVGFPGADVPISDFARRHSPSPREAERLQIALEMLSIARSRGAVLYEVEEGIHTIGG